MAFRNASEMLDSCKGYATKEMAEKKMIEVLGDSDAVALVAKNGANRWIIILIHNPDSHHVSMFAIHKNKNIVVIGN